MKWLKEKFNKFIDSIAYVIWSLAIWMLIYYQFNEINDFEEIRYGYGMTIWLWIIAAIILYGNSVCELAHEILKSCLILIGSSILEMLYNQNGTPDLMIKKIISLLIYQCMGFIVIYFLGKSQKLHGRFAKPLSFIYMGVLGILYLILKWNLLVALIVSSIINLLLGWEFHKFVIKEFNQKQIEQEQEQKENEEIEKKKN